MTLPRLVRLGGHEVVVMAALRKMLLAISSLALGVTDDVQACSLQALHHYQHLQ